MLDYRATVVALVTIAVDWSPMLAIGHLKEPTFSPVIASGLYGPSGPWRLSQRTLRYPRKLVRAGFAGYAGNFPTTIG
jgi:hypothetical protein